MSMYTKLTDTSPRCEQPELITTKMKFHQLAALEYASSLEKSQKINIDNKTFETSVGIIADKVGSGKSLTLLSLIAKNKNLKKDLNKYWSNQFVNVITNNDSNYDYFDVNILVVPHGLVAQWKSYIEKDTNLTYALINTAKTIKPFSQDIKKLEEYDIVLVSSTRYNEVASFFWRNSQNHQIKISRLIFDETDSIKIPSCNKIEAAFYWFITSSYKNLLYPDGQVKYTNSNGDISDYYNYQQGFYNRVVINGIKCRGFIKETLRSINYLMSIDKNIVQKLVIKNANSFVEQSFQIPEPNIIKIVCKNPLQVNILNNMIDKDIISFINAGDIQGAIEKLDCTKVDETNLIKTVTEDLDKDIANKKIEYQMKNQMTYSSDAAKTKSLEKIANKISELESKRETIMSRIQDNNICPICYDNINNQTIANCCQKSFCFECLSPWLSQKSNCPACRHDLTLKDIIVITDKKQEKNLTKDELLNKIDNVKKIIREKINENSKLLIFSEHDNTFVQLTNILNDNNMKYSKIMGQSNTINNTVNKFKSNNEESLSTLLLNSRYFGSGLNLENATDIIIYHNMSKELTHQVIGRAQRPGRSTPLNIYMLCNENEVFDCVI